MKLRLINETKANQIQAISIVTGLSTDKITQQIKNTDPTGGKYTDYILKIWKNNNIRLPEDGYRIKEALSHFDRVKQRLVVRDINQYKTIRQLENAVEPLIGSSSKKQGGSGIDPLSYPGVKLISSNGNVKTIGITDPESLAELGEGTKWCTRKSYPNCQAETYINEYNVINQVWVGDKQLIQYTPDYDQVMDREDEPVIDPELLKLIPPPSLDSDTVDSICSYVINIIGDRWPEAEPHIMINPGWAYRYARYVIGDRWPEAEPHIMISPGWAYRYAYNIIGGRWPEAEPYIMKDPILSHEYTRRFARMF